MYPLNTRVRWAPALKAPKDSKVAARDPDLDVILHPPLALHKFPASRLGWRIYRSSIAFASS